MKVYNYPPQICWTHVDFPSYGSPKFISEVFGTCSSLLKPSILEDTFVVQCGMYTVLKKNEDIHLCLPI